MTSQSNQALLVECQPRRLGSVPGCSAGAGRIRFVRTAGELTPRQPARLALSTTIACNVIFIALRPPVPGIADFAGSSPGIVSYAQRFGPNRSRSPWSYLRNFRSRGPLQFIQSTGGVLMRRTLVGIIAALALGSVSPAAFAADMVPEPAPVMSWTGFYLGAGGGVGWADLDVNHRRCRLAHGESRHCHRRQWKVCSEDEQILRISIPSRLQRIGRWQHHRHRPGRL